jgi:hypothetical protein
MKKTASYFAGRTLMVPMSVDEIWVKYKTSVLQGPVTEQSKMFRALCSWIDEMMQHRCPAGGNTFAPPKKRKGAVTNELKEFLIKNSGLYCTREVLDHLPHLNEGSVISAIKSMKKQGLISNDKDGKWFVKPDINSSRTSNPNQSAKVLDWIRLNPNQYTTTELKQKFPDMKVRTLEGAVYAAQRNGTLERDANGKWSTI